ncbi:MAG: hypothetical protein RUMPE_01316 [Eubacteriales bacterium SKADARSKE-1]|nr:hypothetical protein [Eubacteriales bacterium SKADARSKE-1]MDQ5984270.1 hypothetical protein [Eubacteriales bacterium SKADARSKE-1]
MKKIIAIISVLAITLTGSSSSASALEAADFAHFIGYTVGLAGIGASFVTTPITFEYWEKCHNEREKRQSEHDKDKKELGRSEKTKLIAKECVAAAATFMTPVATVIVACIPGVLLTIPFFILMR